ncbi:DUF551 domain-containing protein [Mesorhizobium liriopis]
MLCIGLGRWFSPDCGPDHWVDAFEPEILFDRPTHWMELPAPPPAS